MKTLNFSGYIAIPLLIFNILFSSHAKAVDFDQTFTSASYNFCGGYVEFKAFYYDADGDDDKVDWMKLYYKNSSGNWVQYWEWSLDHKGGWTHESTEGEDFSFRSNNGHNTSRSWYHWNNNGEYYGNTIILYNPPTDKYGGIIEIRAEGYYNGDGSDPEVPFDYTYTLTVPSVGTPFNVIASTNEYCDRVEIKWSNDATLVSCGATRYSSVLYRDGTQIYDGDATIFNDINAIPGQEHKYKLRTYWKPNSNIGGYFTQYTAEVSGKRFGSPNPPSGLDIEQEGCNGNLKLSWNWQEFQNPSEFVLERSADSTFSTKTTNILGGGIRNYTDNSVNSGELYYYRLFARDKCPDDATQKLSSPYTAFVSEVGKGTPMAPSVDTLILQANNTVKVVWTDNSMNEEGFVVERSSNAGNFTQQLNADTISYIDKSAQFCTPYVYSVKAINSCAVLGVVSPNTKTLTIPADLSQTFSATKKVSVTKGLYGDKVRISWNNNNSGQINAYQVYRINPALADTVLVGSVPSGFKTFDDNTCDANTLYKYQVLGMADCDNLQIFSNISEDHGFRLAYGTINGQITYTGGIAVNGVKVSVNPTAGVSGRSLRLDGIGDRVVIDNTNAFDNNEFTFHLFYKADDLIGSQTLISKKSSPTTGWQLYLDGNNLVFNVNTTNLSISDPRIMAQQYIGVTASYDGSFMRLYLNGEIKDSIAVSAISSNTADIYVGVQDDPTNPNYFQGVLDEMRYFDHALSGNDIWRTHDVYINPSYNGLMAYWRVDAGFGDQLYDYSKVGGLPNQNHGQMYGATWNNDVPSANQLSPGAYTDSLGSYFVPFVPYSGTGENFTITPIFGTHSFSPATKTIFIGGNSVIYNNQDFQDNSSFLTSGSVKYFGSSCFVKDAFVKLDNEIVIKNGLPVKTDASGYFELQVPIGHHVITIEKAGHYFSQGRFPNNGTWDFQQNVTITEPFMDSTKIKVIGRVVGGEREGDKLPGMGLSINNIGQTEIVFLSQQGNGCYSDTVTTDPISGEYEVSLPPINFTIPDFHITTNLGLEFENNALLDLSNANIDVYHVVHDSAIVGGVQIVVDSAIYHQRRDFIHFAPPSLELTNEDGSLPIIGDRIYEREIGGLIQTLLIDSLNLHYPVFSENLDYKMQISAFEIYVNNDKAIPVIDSVPVTTGEIVIYNKLSTNKKTIINLADTSLDFNGVTGYEFRAGNANTTINTITPRYSYTQTLEATLETPRYTVAWQPNSGDGTPSPLFRGFVLGGRALGASFATKGPEVVTMILRDPPGSQSFSTWESGVAKTSSFKWELGGDLGGSLQKVVKLGTKSTFGIGVQTTAEVKNTLTSTTTLEVGGSGGQEFIETVTRNIALSTGSSADFVGGGADLFYGRSMNMDFGLSESIQIIDTSLCGNSSIKCGGPSFGKYRFAAQKGFFMIPGGYNTEFIYTQAFIENNLIPNLKLLRNNLFVAQPQNYLSNLPSTDPNYGSSNDDPIWGALATADPLVFDDVDTTGQSYTYLGTTVRTDTVQRLKYIYSAELDSVITQTVTDTVSYPAGVDSVWFYNQQIRLWIETLRDNEMAKVTLQATDKIRNISYSAGNSYTYVETTSRDTTGFGQWSVGLTEDIAIEIGAELNGTGISAEQSINIKAYTNGSKSTTTQVSSTTAYTIVDNDASDFFSVDIFKPIDGFGPIFKTRGGETSCPYEQESKTKYYQPGKILNQGTIAKELPGIEISPSILFNVPAESQAIFTLSLKNLSPAGEDQSYSLKVIEASNPDGAIINIDGLTPNRDFQVPAGTSISKQLTISKGQLAIDYDSIMFVFHSICDGFDISDTAYVSVHFLPSCTDIEITSPNDKFVLNNTFNDTLPVVLNNYDINYGGLEKIRFEYKPAAQSSWIPIQTWYKDTTGMNNPLYEEISTNTPYTSYFFQMDQLIDQEYNIRAVSTCNIPGVPPTDNVSSVLAGVADRVNPHPFGSPTPASGILSPSDDISIQFNETIEAGSLTRDNFEINGVVNGQPLRHSTSVSFDGFDENMIIPNGLNLSNTSFTIEFWVKRNSRNSVQTIFSQGINANQNISIGFDAGDHLVFKLGNKSLSTQMAYSDTANWHHWAVSYDKTGLAEIMFDGSLIATDNSFYTAYTGSGKTYIGMNATSSSDFFEGNMHELRVWNSAKTLAELVPNLNSSLTGRELNLSGYWPMDEGRGIMTEDRARYRNAEMNATWLLLPSSKSVSFDGLDDYLYGSAGLLAMNQEMDMSIEFWFKSSGNADQAFLSNGSGRFATSDLNRNGWSIEGTSSNTIIVRNDSLTFNAVSTNYFDNNWHHFALVLDRIGNMTAYIDGNQQNNVSSNGFFGFGASKLFIGCRAWFIGLTEQKDRYFNGSIDEVRIWNTARLREQIELEMYNRLPSDQIGLMAYYPFEHYESVMGVPLLTPATTDESMGTTDLLMQNGATYNNETPSIKLQRPVQGVNYNWSVNNDKIVITPTEQPANIEDVTLSISVKDVKDLHGNIMQSPKSWIAYVDKNQVLWQDQQINLAKKLNDTLSFQTKIINRGGETKSYTISNLPAWLQASSTSGSIAPQSQQTVVFTVDQSINIGEYSQDLHLTTDFGFDEKLLINLKVFQESPNWSVDPSKFQFSMSIIGQIKINNNISNNPGDKVVAFVNGQVRGVANLNYIKAYDNYQAYLDIYSNTSSGDSIVFMVWSASLGKVLVEVDPDNMLFSNNDLHGTPANPMIFDAVENIDLPIALNNGWTWISLPLINRDLSSVNTILKSVETVDGDIIKNQTHYDQSASGNWLGSLSNSGGFTNTSTYKIKISQLDTLEFTGVPHDPDTVPIQHNMGWNWIAFVPIANQTVNVALNSYNATEGDILKSQSLFAYYDANMGWIGSLQFMKPGQGYLLKSATNGSFTYPRAGLFRLKDEAPSIWEDRPSHWIVEENKYPGNMNLIISLNICNEDLKNSRFAIGAFSENHCKGVAYETINLNNLGKEVFFLTVNGEKDENLVFRIYDRTTGEEYQSDFELGFQENVVHGTTNTPIKVMFNAEISCLDNGKVENDGNKPVIYPNPFLHETNILLPLSMINAETVELVIYNAMGKEVKHYTLSNTHKIKWKGEDESGRTLPAGIYYISFRDQVREINQKIIKLN